MAAAGKKQDDDELVPRQKYVWERELRLWSGLVLMMFVTMHLANHALAILGLGIAEVAQDWRMAVWRSLPGTLLLYGAGLVHMLLALKRAAKRRTIRMPWDEALQLALGLLIPLFLIGHIAGTRISASVFDINESYSRILPRLWEGRALGQTMLVILTWSHGCLGLYHAWRWKPWFRRWRTGGLVLAALLPVLALAGFVVGAREAIALHLAPEIMPIGGSLVIHYAIQTLLAGFSIILAALVLFVVVRVLAHHKHGLVTLKYVGHGAIRVPRGTTVLDASRVNNIPHPSRCGGRARCATCRVLVIASDEALPAPSKAEASLLERIAAPAQVRLACQLHAGCNMTVQVLLPFLARVQGTDTHEDAFRWGVSHEITVLFVNMRAFNLMVNRHFPQDLVILVNRFTAEMTQAVEAHGGRVNTILADGLMAIFGLDGKAGAGSKQAIACARDMLKAARILDAELAGTLSIPIRVGIGIHTGPAVVARFGDPERGQMICALGETVSIADRLENATKQLLTDCLISQETLTASGLRLANANPREIVLPHRDAPVIAFALKDAPAEVTTI